jgi:PAS domain S-box-containing protein
VTSSAPIPVPRPVDSSAAARWERWLPAWVRRIGTAVWVTGDDGNLVFVNEQAEELLGVVARDAVGRPCRAVVAARTACGASFCAARCPFVVAADAGGEVPTAEVRIGRTATGHWVHLTAIPVEHPDGSGRWIVHSARLADRERRLEDYVARIARRSGALREIESPSERRPLSAREREVLELLAKDVEIGRIAHQLGLSCATVRNHVQHLLAKLGAHSTEEAVAMHVLAQSGANGR